MGWQNVIAQGGSQGGALALITAGLDERVTACVANHPALSDMAVNLLPGCIKPLKSNNMLQRERELIESLRQSEIANVVTKGLNPNVPMKDSGIPWIGMIPEHWEVKKMRNIFKLAHEKANEERNDLLSLSQYTGIKFKSDCEKQECLKLKVQSGIISYIKVNLS